ncbi:putative inorganic phosphate transporter 1-13 [Lolium rigidum]|uniref:putative inorganic phosphate transporter 1-13 n=1 Tax=Lolium rigidum TaxID=89674 RepID=UPI001F5D712E|nr:putative inorganic phosphate transporter 1-13 [Lolium rigidum]
MFTTWPARRHACSSLFCHLNGVGSAMLYRMLDAVTSVKCETRRARKQIKVLQALDVAGTQLYHFTTIVIAGMGFFTDAYDLFSVSLIADLLGRIYYNSADGKLPSDVAGAVSAVALCGTLLGQLFFGWLGDRMGRKRIYGVTLKLMVVCSLASGLSFHYKPKCIIATLCFFRFWLGFGVGGDYPLSATIMSEYANKRTRGAFIAAVFAMQGLGNLAAGAVVLALSARFKNTAAYETDPVGQADYVWRIVLMLGAVPALLTYYWRMKMPETARYTALIAKNLKLAASDMAAVLDIDIVPEKEEADAIERNEEYGLFSMDFLRRHGRQLLSTTVCWFVLDVVFYSLNLFMKDIFSGIGWFGDASQMSPLEQTYEIARTQAIIVVSGSLPGYFLTVLLVDRIGRIKIQLMGFTMMTIFMIGLAASYKFWSSPSMHAGFAIMYAFTLFFANFGPNSTTFILPTEIFPTRLRSTCNGISAAGGKCGAIIGVLWFQYSQTSIRSSLLLLAGCNLVGIMFTLALPETKGMSLEDITGEMEEVSEPSEESATVAEAEFIHSVEIS